MKVSKIINSQQGIDKWHKKHEGNIRIIKRTFNDIETLLNYELCDEILEIYPDIDFKNELIIIWEPRHEKN